MTDHDQEITVSNLGPIQALTIKLLGYGVTCLTAPNGSGKSIMIDALQSLAAGDGGLPLKDGADRGSIDGLGIHATILPKQTRCAGEFRLANLEGKLDLAAIVNPGVKDPEAADRRRIRALVSMSGVKASTTLFTNRTEFPIEVFEHIAQADSINCDDLVEMAQRIARDYQAEARQWERMAGEDAARAKALAEQAAGLDLDAESDTETLQAAFIAANSKYGVAEGRCNILQEKRVRADEAQQELAELEALGSLDLDAATNRLRSETTGLVQAQDDRNKLRAAIAEMQAQLVRLDSVVAEWKLNVEKAQRHEEQVRARCETREKALRVIADYEAYEAPSGDELASLKSVVEKCREAMETGVRIRDAQMFAAQQQEYEKSAQTRREVAETYRAAAAATDNVVSDAIQSDVFKVGTAGKYKRLLAWHETRGDWVPYHDLSEAEKWTRAIDEGILRVGQSGLLFVRQEAWEGVDVWNRKAIDAYAREKGVYILTAEATRVESDGKEFVAKQFQSQGGAYN